MAGEVRTSGYANIPKIVRDTILEIGYDNSYKGFDGRTCGVEISIGDQEYLLLRESDILATY